MNQKILVPIDFSEVTKSAIETAICIAAKNKMTISLLHIENPKSPGNAEEKMLELTRQAKSTSSIAFEYLVKQGNILDTITSTTNDLQFGFVVIGSHGYKGLREKVFGTDILKLLRNIPIPVITVQKDCPKPQCGFKNILFPIGSHDLFIHKIEATIFFAQLFDSEVHLYSVEKPGSELSEKAVQNILLAQKEFEKNNINYKRVKETPSSFSVGYAKQVMDYAKRSEISLIAFMANITMEHYFFADSDKESLLTNDAAIPVLTTNNKRVI